MNSDGKSRNEGGNDLKIWGGNFNATHKHWTS